MVQGIVQEEQAAVVSLFPNPYGEGQLHIAAGTFSGAAEVSLFSATGQQVFRETRNVSNGEVTLAGLNLSPGSYFVRVKNAAGSFTGKLLVTQ